MGMASETDIGCANGTPKLRVGCALLPKKVARYLTPIMKETAARSGVDLCLIDYTKPLSEQGDFDAIVHKLRPNKEWEANLLEYVKQHPNVKVIDKVDGIRTLQNRSTMLTALHGNGIVLQPTEDTSSGGLVRVQAPVQVEIPEGMEIAEAEKVLASKGFRPPLIVKSMWTDGREGSHNLAVLHDIKALANVLQGHKREAELKPPLVVQQFVEHGGVLYKIFVLGRQTFVTRRQSLGDSHFKGDIKKGLQQLPRISCKLLPGTGPANPAAAGEDDDDTNLPPKWLTSALAKTLRERLGLQLFNFDLICPERQEVHGDTLYYVVDINYFPGVDKIPGFETVFVNFLLSTCTEEATELGAELIGVC